MNSNDNTFNENLTEIKTEKNYQQDIQNNIEEEDEIDVGTTTVNQHISKMEREIFHQERANVYNGELR